MDLLVHKQNGFGSTNGFAGHNDDDEEGGHPLDTETMLTMRSPEFLARFGLGAGPTDHHQIETATTQVLRAVGEDVTREGLQRTPDRVARMYDELLSGYRTDPVKMINDALFDVDYTDMVIVRDIEFASLCEHHMLPFLGHAHVAYIPNGKVIGLSKIPRIVDMFARRLQVQERMTRQIADFVNEVLHPAGVAVVIEGIHMCARLRGVKKEDVSMTTSAMLGVFADRSLTRSEFMDHLNRPSVRL